MTTEAEYRYLFRGSALAAGGRIRRPDLVIQSQAPAHVGVSGGASRVTTKGAAFGSVFRYAAAESDVVADYQNPAAAVQYTHGNHAQNRLPTRTTVHTAISDLAIVNTDSATRRTLTCVKMSVAMVSEWPGLQGETSFPAIRPAITTLMLDDYELEVTFVTDIFGDRDTKGKLKHAYETSDAFRRVYDRLFFRPEGRTFDSTRLPEAGGEVFCTIVSRLSWKQEPNPYARIDGHKVVFKDFGTIYFGEMFISQFSRRLTLMRVELGSPCGGSMDFAEVETNGHAYPPY